MPAKRGRESPLSINRELINQAFAYVQRHFPPSFTPKLDAARARWVRLA